MGHREPVRPHMQFCPGGRQGCQPGAARRSGKHLRGDTLVDLSRLQTWGRVAEEEAHGEDGGVAILDEVVGLAEAARAHGHGGVHVELAKALPPEVRRDAACWVYGGVPLGREARRVEAGGAPEGGPG